jgi:hypothetical protein
VHVFKHDEHGLLPRQALNPPKQRLERLLLPALRRDIERRRDIAGRQRMQLGDQRHIFRVAGAAGCGRTKTEVGMDRSRLRYPSDVTDEEWASVEALEALGMAVVSKLGKERLITVNFEHPLARVFV